MCDSDLEDSNEIELIAADLGTPNLGTTELQINNPSYFETKLYPSRKSRFSLINYECTKKETLPEMSLNRSQTDSTPIPSGTTSSLESLSRNDIQLLLQSIPEYLPGENLSIFVNEVGNLCKHLEGGMEITKKAEKKLDNLNKENDDLKLNLDEHKKRIEILKARCKVLENEQALNKAKISSLTTQTERDQNILRTLSCQLTNHQDVKNETIKQKDKCIKGLQQDNEILRIELSRQGVTIQNLTKDLNDKVEEIRDLMKNRRKSPRPSSSYGQKHKNLIDDRHANRLEVEKTKLLELTEIQAARLIKEREAHSKTQNRLRSERQKAAKLETNLARLELEMSSVRSGGSYCTLSTNRSIDIKNNNTSDIKDELELAQETIKALKTRLEIEQHERKVDLKEFAKILESDN
ncbi:hypothetical protein HHI36_001248 [Cryptolaemus montrouzieri]|uniref:Uncharacterized protein n=1 Tax=Cryptolaemus montrouzieri TaxID=559131 RepID=A0ABD2P792_9CUCU